MSPSSVVSNHDLQETHGFDPDWIVNRTGIHERRFALPHQATSDLCTQAAIRCLKAARPRAERRRPAGRRHVHARHGISLDGEPGSGPAQAGLPGVRRPGGVRGLRVRPGHRRAVRRRRATASCALVIGGDCNSRVINPGDQKSFPLFGDGAGAVLLAPGEADQGLVAYQLGSDGSGGDLLSRPACGSRIPPVRRGPRTGAALPHDGRPRRLQVGRADPGRLHPRRPGPRRLPGARHPLVHPPPGQRPDHPRRQRRARAFTATPSSRTWSDTATPPPARSRSHSTS